MINDHDHIQYLLLGIIENLPSPDRNPKFLFAPGKNWRSVGNNLLDTPFPLLPVSTSEFELLPNLDRPSPKMLLPRSKFGLSTARSPFADLNEIKAKLQCTVLQLDYYTCLHSRVKKAHDLRIQ